MAKTIAKPSILIVEDEPKMRRLLELQLAEEGFLAQTAGDAEAGLKLLNQGNFDIVVTDFKLPGNCTFTSSYEIVVKNAKSEPAQVLVVEPIPGDWTITQENLAHEKTSSSTATWTLNVPAGGSTALDYTAVVKVCL